MPQLPGLNTNFWGDVAKKGNKEGSTAKENRIFMSKKINYWTCILKRMSNSSAKKKTFSLTCYPKPK